MAFPRVSVVSTRGQPNLQIRVQPNPGLLQSVGHCHSLQDVQALTFRCTFSFKVTARQFIVCVFMYVYVDQMHRFGDPREFQCFQRM